MTDDCEKEIHRLFGETRPLEGGEIAFILLNLLARIQALEEKLKEKNA